MYREDNSDDNIQIQGIHLEEYQAKTNIQYWRIPIHRSCIQQKSVTILLGIIFQFSSSAWLLL